MTYVLIEGVFYDKWVAKKIVGETTSFWELESCRTGDVRKHKKSVTHLLRGYDTAEDATRAADQLTSKIAGAKKHYEIRKRAILAEFNKGVKV